jgi:M6 family metalloprotease-like protein
MRNARGWRSSFRPRRWTPEALAWLLSAVLVTAASGFPSSSDASRLVPPPGRTLSAEETRLWYEQGVDTPAPHLLGPAAIRASGGETDLGIVVILVDFPDFPADRAVHTPEYYQTLFFSHGVLPEGSVAEFLEASSGGKLHLTGTVRGWFTVSSPKNDYTNGRGGVGYYPANSQRLAEEALFLADNTVNFADYDNEGPDGVPDSGDDDELVDGFVVIHAGNGRETGGTTANDFISLQWWTPENFPVDGVFGRYFTLNAETANLGVIVHELGHLMGLPDLYDTSGRSYGVGVWSMMAGGFNLLQGTRPSDFDAYCKSKLGFLSPVSIYADTKDIVISPSIDGGKVLRLWRSGEGGTEYFLLENRRPEGLDAALPGGGLLLYHVDERIQNNSNPNHYKVAVEQADGLFQLEARYNNPSIGDAGDPYTAGDAFGRYTVPSNLDYLGADTYVHVYNIRGPDPQGAYTVDVNVQEGPLVELVDLNRVELVGNGNGMVEGGETAGVYPRVAVSRLPAQNVVLRARSLDPRAVLLDSLRTLGTIAAGETADLTEPLRVQIAAGLPTDPYGVPLQLELSWDNAPPRTVPAELGIGTVVGRNDDFENPDTVWTHGPVRPTAFDQWTYGPGLGKDGTAGFKLGYYTVGYMKGDDAVLTSPPILLPPDAVLSYDQAVDIAEPDTTRPQGVGVIEISVNGGDWQTAYPEDGYPETFGGNHLEWIGRQVFAGTQHGGSFYPVKVDLSAYRGSIRVRFRFFSEVEARVGNGWRIDNVRVTQEVTPVRVLGVTSSVEGNDVRLDWTLAEPFPSNVRWRRGPQRSSATVVGDGWMIPAGSASVIDAGGAAALPADYWLEGLERDGTVSAWGPYRVEGVRLPLSWTVSPSPARPPFLFAWSRGLPPGAQLEVFDLEGRRVYRTDVPAGPGSVGWDGRDEGGRTVAPGIYFARMRGSALPPLRLVRLP